MAKQVNSTTVSEALKTARELAAKHGAVATVGELYHSPKRFSLVVRCGSGESFDGEYVARVTIAFYRSKLQQHGYQVPAELQPHA